MIKGNELFIFFFIQFRPLSFRKFILIFYLLKLVQNDHFIYWIMVRGVGLDEGDTLA